MEFKEWWDNKTGFENIRGLPTPEKLAEAAWDFQSKKLETCLAAADSSANTIDNLLVQLAESQAREDHLREALKRLECGHYYNDFEVGLIASEALAMPRDDTALKAMLAMAENKVELLAEDIECLHMCLDELEVPRASGGNVYSMWGRVQIALRSNDQGKKLETCLAAADSSANTIDNLFVQLAESQAREKVLRNTLHEIKWYRPIGSKTSKYALAIEILAGKALQEPTDETALKALLGKEQERCASVCEGEPERLTSEGTYVKDQEACILAIRALT